MPSGHLALGHWFNYLSTTLAGILRPEIDLSKSRVETVCLIIVGMISARTLGFWRLGDSAEHLETALTTGAYPGGIPALGPSGS